MKKFPESYLSIYALSTKTKTYRERNFYKSQRASTEKEEDMDKKLLRHV
jgi:hypothetical protein